MVLEKLGESLRGTLKRIASAVFVDDKLINELVKDIQRSLLQSDVNVKLVLELSNKIKGRIKNEDTPGSITRKEHLINIVYEELVAFLGDEGARLEVPAKKPFIIMLVGLFGNGKTTTAGKLARYFSKRGKKVALVGLDVHRPAAMDQLQQIADKAGVAVYVKKGENDPLKIWAKYRDEAGKSDVVIIVTAGRDALSHDLIKEIEAIHREVQPDENLLVISADIGQAAQKQAEQFHASCGITGVVATKMEGTAKAGGALSACAVTEAPIKFIGVGESLDDIESFNPKNFVGRLLGMGDIEALLEKAEGAISQEDAEDLGKRLLKGEFTLIDLYEQMEAMKKMGPLTKIVEMIPGFSQIKLPKEALQVQQEKLKLWKHAMDSMTKGELEDPEEIGADRVERIAKGSGVQQSDIREMLKQYRQSRKMMKMMKGSGDVSKIMKKMQGRMPKGFGV